MATEALEHNFFKSNSLNTSSSPSGSGSCHDDSCQSNPQHQIKGSLKSCTSSLPFPVKEQEDPKDQTKEDEDDDKEQQLLEASQDSGVGTQDAEDTETWQERDKNSSLTDSLLTNTTELDLFECKELEEWGWEEEEYEGSTANRPSHEDAVSLVKPPAKRMKP